jgi:hypothetical protein
MIDYYAAIITSRKEVLKDLSKYIVVGVYFSKYSFVSQVYKAGFETISRLRVDTVLQYAFCEKKKQDQVDLKPLTEKSTTNRLISITSQPFQNWKKKKYTQLKCIVNR